MAACPGAIAAEPIPETAKRKPTEAEASELKRLVAAIYADDTEADQAEALAHALSDHEAALESYRAIAAGKARKASRAAPTVEVPNL